MLAPSHKRSYSYDVTRTALCSPVVAIAALLAGLLPASALAASNPAGASRPHTAATEMTVTPAETSTGVWSKTAPATAPAESLSDPPAVEVIPEPAPVVSKPAPESSPAAPAPADPAPEPQQPPPGDGNGTATAENESLTYQVLVQVQRGCRRYCHGTRQTQIAEQVARTTQDAVAHTPAGGGQALATNTSRTVQFVWQAQLGCVAFCYGTSQLQLALQIAETTQSATATGDSATAANETSTDQWAFQLQRGCRFECYDENQIQVLAQGAETTQGAYAEEDEDLEELTLAFTEIEAWARNLNATVQISFQFQDSDCRHDCQGGSQDQQGVQRSAVTQQALAVATEGTEPGLE